LKIPEGSWIENGFILTEEIKVEDGKRVKYIYKQKIVEKRVQRRSSKKRPVLGESSAKHGSRETGERRKVTKERQTSQ
jgi:single-stranded DNA-binding protein